MKLGNVEGRAMATASLLAFGMICAVLPAMAATVWDEGIQGDLSDDAGTPTELAIGLGSNTIIGSMQSPADTRDFVTFTVPEGQQLTLLLQQQYEDVASGGGGDRGFHAINAGPTSFVPGPDTADLFLGGAHLDPLPPGTDMLEILAAAPQAGTGFSVPLGPGVYSYVIQQTGPELTAYTIEFVLEAAAADVGGTVSDVFTQVAVCRNLVSGQTVVVSGLAGAPAWNCTAAGLVAGGGDRVLQLVRGRAACGGEPCDIGGTVAGVDGLVAVCRNLVTGQSVTTGVDMGSYACAGLSATNGDGIQLVIVGSVPLGPDGDYQ